MPILNWISTRAVSLWTNYRGLDWFSWVVVTLFLAWAIVMLANFIIGGIGGIIDRFLYMRKWHWRDDYGIYVPYSDEISQRIEDSWQNVHRKKNMRVTVDNERYVEFVPYLQLRREFNFPPGESIEAVFGLQRRAADRNRVRPVARKILPTPTWHGFILRTFLNLLADIPFIPMFLILSVTWRARTLWRQVFSKENPVTDQKRRMVVGTEFLYLLADIPCGVLFLANMILAYRAKRVYTAVRNPNESDSWWTIVLLESMLAFLEPFALLGTLIVRATVFRNVVLDEELARLTRLALPDPHSQRALYGDSLMKRIEHGLFLLFDVVLGLALLVLCVVAPWRFPIVWKDLAGTPLAVYRRNPINSWGRTSQSEIEQILLDIAHWPLLLLCVVLFWRLPSLYRSVREWVLKDFPARSELLRGYVREEAKTGLLDILCVFVLLLVVVTVYRLPGLLSAWREKTNDDSWRDVLVKEFMSREHRMHATGSTTGSSGESRGRTGSNNNSGNGFSEAPVYYGGGAAEVGPAARKSRSKSPRVRLAPVKRARSPASKRN